MLFRLSYTRFTLGIAIVLFACLTLAVVTRWQQPASDLSSEALLNNKPAAESKPNQFSDTELTSADDQTKAKVIESYGKLPLHFEPNEGQIDSNDVKFTSRGDGYNLFLSSAEAKLVLSRPAASTEKENLRNTEKTNPNRELLKKDSSIKPDTAKQTEQSVIQMNLLGANTESTAKAVEELEGKSNYFIGNDQSKWRTNVANYKKVRFEQVYSGIDVEYYGNQRQLEYDFIVAPNADPNQIKLSFDGIENLQVNNEGELVLETKSGEQIKQKKPFVYQKDEDGKKMEVAGSYKVEVEEVSFEIGEYDKSKQLIIDPIVLVYSTYLGGRYLDEGLAIAVDAAGNAYVTGFTESINFPISNARQSTYGGVSDVFVTKINSSGSALVYSTFLGGGDYDRCYGITVDSANNVYVTGSTNSLNFPVLNALQPTINRYYDAFITKINSLGNELLYSTYLGGSSYDFAAGIAVDSDRNIYIAGDTDSLDFPTSCAVDYQNFSSTNGLQLNGSATSVSSSRVGGNRVLRLTPAQPQKRGSAWLTTKQPVENGFGATIFFQITDGLGEGFTFTLQNSSAGTTALGGDPFGYSGITNSVSVQFDASRNELRIATNGSSTPIATVASRFSLRGAVQRVDIEYEPGQMKIYHNYATTPDLTVPIDITNFGLDEGKAYVGFTAATGTVFENHDIISWSFRPSCNGVIQPSNRGNSDDVFVTKINSSGSALVYSTYLGGSSFDIANGIAVDSLGNAYIVGDTRSPNFPTANARQPTYRDGGGDAFVAKINSSGNGFIYSTYLGGSNYELGYGIAADSAGNTYVTGRTSSLDFPVSNAIQSRHGGGNDDAFVTKFNAIGSAYIYSTYLGGTNYDQGNSIAIDYNGNAYITGETASENFPLVNALQTSHSFGLDAFVTKLNPSGNRFVFSTYFGGAKEERGYHIVQSNDGYIYLTGLTKSPDFPVANAIQPIRASSAGTTDASCQVINSAPLSSFQLNGSVTMVNSNNFRLTPAQPNQRGSVWLKTKKSVQDGFETRFNFKITGGQGEGFTFTIQNSPDGILALGGSPSCGSCLGYTGITNSVSVQFDVARNEVRVATNGSPNPIASTTNIPLMRNGEQYRGGILYNQGRLKVGVTTGGTAGIYQLDIPIDLSNFGLDNGSAYVGFTAATGTSFANQDVYTWIFYPGCHSDSFISKFTIPISSVSGHVLTASGRPIVGVQLNSSGDTFNKVLSDNNGDYLIDLIEGNNYTFAPSFSSHRFSPSAYSFSPLTGDQANVNFTATLINDNFSDAVTLAGVFGNVSGNNQDATRQSGEPTHAGQSGNKSVWYKIRSLTTGQASFSTYGSSFDTTLAVYTGTSLNNLTEVARSDDAASFDQTSRVTFGAVAGTDYWIAVDGKQPGQSGNFKINYFTTSVTVSGIVTRQNVQQSGLTVRATSTNNTTVAYTTTAANGSYSLTIPAGSYNFAVFQGSVQQGGAVTLLDVSVNRTLNIEIQPSPSGDFNGAGSIRLPVNAIIAGLQAYAEGPNGTRLPCQLFDNATRFVCVGLIPGNSYLVKVTSPNYEFMPNDIPLNNVQSNYLDLKFEAIHYLSGRIVNGNSRVFGATVSIRGNNPQGLQINTTTNAAGEYIARVPTGYNYTVIPSLTGLAFMPPQSNFTNLNNHQIADFSVVNNCSYTVSPAFSITVPAGGGETLVLNLTTGSNCSWTSAASEPWITINQASRNGVGNTAVTYSVLENPATVSRTATITVAGQTVTINQSAAQPVANSVLYDFDGDGKADISVYRPDNGVWYLLQSNAGFTDVQFGISTDRIVPADYDGDGRTDVAVYRDGIWYLQRSTAGFTGIAFGEPNDIPQPADFDGDGKAEIVVYRPSVGTWFVLNLVNNQFSAAQFGNDTDKPVVGDYDGDGKADYAVYRPSVGVWYLLRSRDGFTGIQFGITADTPVPADYDGDGKTDVAVFRSGVWYLLQSNLGFTGFQFGLATDLPAPADFDGDGKADAAVFRDGTWYLLQSTAGFNGVGFGVSTDKPVPNAFVP